YREEPAVWEADFDADGFFWVDCQDRESNVISFVRQNANSSRQVLAILNLSPVSHQNYRIGLPRDGWWREALNSDAEIYGGGNCGNGGGVHAEEVPWHNQPFSGEFLLPSLACLIFQRE
ncbi:MAG: alpha amylase C-terminal domain-containing protein, partial [Verrucomicrobiota bacterium]|nr:alpha amylase C-terminal domain-containing protein [Verrucomicrobiota bacterium]